MEGQTSPALLAMIGVGLRGVTSLASVVRNIVACEEIVRITGPDVGDVGPRSLGRVTTPSAS